MEYQRCICGSVHGDVDGILEMHLGGWRCRWNTRDVSVGGWRCRWNTRDAS